MPALICNACATPMPKASEEDFCDCTCVAYCCAECRASDAEERHTKADCALLLCLALRHKACKESGKPFEMSIAEAAMVIGLRYYVNAYYWVEATDSVTGETYYVDALEYYQDKEEEWIAKMEGPDTFADLSTVYYKAWDEERLPAGVEILMEATRVVWACPGALCPASCRTPHEILNHFRSLKSALRTRSLSASAAYIHEHGGRMVAGSKGLALEESVWRELQGQLAKKKKREERARLKTGSAPASPRRVTGFYWEYGNGSEEWEEADTSAGMVISGKDGLTLVAF